jgi:putative phage-type endonuclease
MLLSELEELEDILDKLIFEEEPSIFTEEYTNEFVETAMLLMDEYINLNPHIISEPAFYNIILEEITDIFYIQMEEHIEDLNNGDIIEDEMNELIEAALKIFLTTFYPDKLDNINIFEQVEYDDEEIFIIKEKIQKLREIPQPVQRTLAWYIFRWNLITASNAWKAFESQPTINQLIYEKCQPLKDLNNQDEEEQNKMVNTNTPLHWGQKYEPLSVLLYESMYNTKVEDFGCIQHSVYKFLGASPDGINVDTNSERFGRMLEIKNVVSRDINGIPKKEYWTQMQLQMEVCDLDSCDFLETKFVEYSDTQSFYNDVFIDENGNKNLTMTADKKTKGIIMYFHTKESKPFYSYKPLNVISDYDIQCWEETELEKYEAAPFNYIFFKFIYWKLEVFSCVLILRNCEWFKNNIGQLEKVWKTIEEERITGYEHRAPIKKSKKEPLKPFVGVSENQGCLLKFNKIIKVDT